MNRTVQLGEVQVDEAQLASLCRRYGVRELALFGSAARGDMRPESDIDLLVEFLPDANVGLVERAGLMLDLAQLLGRRVDLVIEERTQTAHPIFGACRGTARLCGAMNCTSATSSKR